MNEQDKPVTSPEMVESAAASARARVTYPNLKPEDPAHPLTDGGFWKDFMRSLEGRWKQRRKKYERESNTFDKDDAEKQTKLV